MSESTGKSKLWIVAAVVGGFTLLCCGGLMAGGNRSQTTANTPAATEAASEATTATPAAPDPAVASEAPPAAAPDAPAAPSHKVGDTVTFPEDSEWQIVEVKDLGHTAKSNNQFQEAATTDGRFVRIQFKLKNLGADELRVMSRPTIIDAKGREFKGMDSVSFYIPKNTKMLAMEAVGPGLAKTFYDVYELPSDASGLNLKIWEAHKPFGADEALVNLGL